MKVTLLGTGTSTGVPIPGCDCEVCTSDNPKNNRLRVSALIEIEQSDGALTTVLIDTTPDLRQQALRYGFSKLDAVLYTHTHADHVFGIDDLRAFNFINKCSIPVYASATSADMLEQTFHYCFFPDPNYQGGSPPKLEMNRIEPYQPVALAGVEIIPLRIMHGKMEILGYRVGSFAYLTDCSEIPDETLPYLEELDTLVLDGLRHRPHKTHLTLEQAAQVAEQLGARRTYLTHMSHEVEHEDGNQKLSGFTSAQVELAYDGLIINC